MQEFKGFTKIFSFTISQQFKIRSFKLCTIILGLLCFIIPAVIIPLIAVFDNNDSGSIKTNEVCAADSVIVVNDSVSLRGIETANVLPLYDDITLDTADDLESAFSRAENKTLILYIEESGGSFSLTTILPDDTELKEADADILLNDALSAFHSVLARASGLDEAQLQTLNAPVLYEQNVVEHSNSEEIEINAEKDAFYDIRQLFSFIIPYLNIMVLYFLVLIYGQGAANSVIMEKTSKLMDTFLVSVKPGAMVLGKVLAICLCAVLQFLIWFAALLAGLAAGCVFARLLVPDSSLSIVMLFDNISIFSQIFSPLGIFLGILIVIAGLLLYCSLSAVGASMAGKPEDLASTNSLFTIMLLFSFMLIIYSGGFAGGINPSNWMCYFPFSSVLIVPANAMLGLMSPRYVLLSLLIIVLAALGLMYIAGKLYKMLALYKGNPLKLGKALAMLRKNRT